MFKIPNTKIIVYIKVSYDEKDKVKGWARWSPDKKLWYYIYELNIDDELNITKDTIHKQHFCTHGYKIVSIDFKSRWGMIDKEEEQKYYNNLEQLLLIRNIQTTKEYFAEKTAINERHRLLLLENPDVFDF